MSDDLKPSALKDKLRRARVRKQRPKDRRLCIEDGCKAKRVKPTKINGILCATEYCAPHLKETEQRLERERRARQEQEAQARLWAERARLLEVADNADAARPARGPIHDPDYMPHVHKTYSGNTKGPHRQ